MRKFLHLLAGFLAMAVSAPSWAGSATWQTGTAPTLSGKPQSVTLSNGNKTATDKDQALVMLAVDFSAKRAWIRHNKKRLWWDGSTSNTNIASVTGFDLSSLGTQSLRFGMHLGKASGSGCSARIHTTAAEIESEIPSGFSAWDDIVGTTTFNSGTVVNATVSEGNKSIAITADPGKVETTASFPLGSTGKAVIEIATNHFQTNVCEYYFFNLLGSSFTFPTDTPNMDPDAVAVTSGSPGVSYWYYNSTPSSNDGGAFAPNSYASNPTNYYRLQATTNQLVSSKTYFEVDFTSLTSTFLGITNSNVQGFWSPFNTTFGHIYPGINSTEVGVRLNDGVCYTNSSTLTCNVAAVTSFPRTVGVAVDTSNYKIWFIHNQSGSPTWYGSASGADPTTNTNGLTSWIGNFGTGPQYPSVGLSLSGDATINGGASGFTYASAYSSLVSAGYTMLDTPSGGNQSIIFGTKENLRRQASSLYPELCKFSAADDLLRPLVCPANDNILLHGLRLTGK